MMSHQLGGARPAPPPYISIRKYPPRKWLAVAVWLIALASVHAHRHLKDWFAMGRNNEIDNSNRRVYFEVYDNRYQVLAGETLEAVLDMESPSINLILADYLREYTRMARRVENEPMLEPVMKVYCAIDKVKLRTVVG